MSPGPAKSQAEEQAAATAKPAVYGPELPPSTIRDVRLPDQTQALHRDQEFRVHSAHGYYVFLSPSSPDAPRLRYGAEISKVSQLVKMSDDPLLFTGIADFSKFSPEKLPIIVGADAQAKALLTLLRSVSPEDRPGLYARFCATTERYFNDRPAEKNERSESESDPGLAAYSYLQEVERALVGQLTHKENLPKPERETTLNAFLGANFRLAIDNGGNDALLGVYTGANTKLNPELRVDARSLLPDGPATFDFDDGSQLEAMMAEAKGRPLTDPEIRELPAHIGERILSARQRTWETPEGWKSSAVLGVFSTDSFSFLVVAKSTVAGESETTLVPLPGKNGNRSPFAQPAYSPDGVVADGGAHPRKMEPIEALMRLRPHEQWEHLLREAQAGAIETETFPLDAFINPGLFPKPRETQPAFSIFDPKPAHPFQFQRDGSRDGNWNRLQLQGDQFSESHLAGDNWPARESPGFLALQGIHARQVAARNPSLQERLLGTFGSHDENVLIQEAPRTVDDENNGTRSITVNSLLQTRLNLQGFEVTQSVDLPLQLQRGKPTDAANEDPSGVRFLRLQADPKLLERATDSDRPQLALRPGASAREWSMYLPKESERVGDESFHVDRLFSELNSSSEPRPAPSVDVSGLRLPPANLNRETPPQLPPRMQWLLDGLANGNLEISDGKIRRTRIVETEFASREAKLHRTPTNYSGSDPELRRMTGASDPLAYIPATKLPDVVELTRSLERAPTPLEQRYSDIRSELKLSPALIETIQTGLHLRRMAIDLEKYVDSLEGMKFGASGVKPEAYQQLYRNWATQLRAVAADLVATGISDSLKREPWQSPGLPPELVALETRIDDLRRTSAALRYVSNQAAAGDQLKWKAAQATVARIDAEREALEAQAEPMRAQAAKIESLETPAASAAGSKREQLSEALQSSSELRTLTGYYVLREAELTIYDNVSTPVGDQIRAMSHRRLSTEPLQISDATDRDARALVAAIQESLGVTSRQDRYRAQLFGKTKDAASIRDAALSRVLTTLRAEAEALDTTGNVPTGTAAGATAYLESLQSHPSFPKGSVTAGSPDALREYYSFLATKWREFYAQKQDLYTGLSDEKRVQLTKSLFNQFFQFEGLTSERAEWSTKGIGTEFKQNPYNEALSRYFYPATSAAGSGYADDPYRVYSPEYLPVAQQHARGYQDFMRKEILRQLQATVDTGAETDDLRHLVQAGLLTPRPAR